MSKWTEIIKNEDRLIENSDRRYRRHCISLDNMSSEGIYRLSSRYVKKDDPVDNIVFSGFLEEFESQRLARAFAQLTGKQQQVIMLIYFEGCNQAEAAKCMGCAISSLSELLARALLSLRNKMNN